MNILRASAFAAVFGSLLGISPADATPLSAGIVPLKVIAHGQSQSVQPAHATRRRHCHGRRRCHGGNARRFHYFSKPSPYAYVPQYYAPYGYGGYGYGYRAYGYGSTWGYYGGYGGHHYGHHDDHHYSGHHGGHGGGHH